MTMNGSDDDRRAVEALRKKISGDFIWFIHNGNAYVINDVTTVQGAKQLYAPMDELGKQQEELGKQQEELGQATGSAGQTTGRRSGRCPRQFDAKATSIGGKTQGAGRIG